MRVQRLEEDVRLGHQCNARDPKGVRPCALASREGDAVADSGAQGGRHLLVEHHAAVGKPTVQHAEGVDVRRVARRHGENGARISAGY